MIVEVTVTGVDVAAPKDVPALDIDAPLIVAIIVPAVICCPAKIVMLMAAMSAVEVPTAVE